MPRLLLPQVAAGQGPETRLERGVTPAILEVMADHPGEIM
ncbi:hypothetical protein R2601_15165 [Salipiger bermudensis HTCC2601]|uniref:Uncharacterized protein n=1 Tax=Salipiger bermudensis (strain DSM 26914 / JCM 13377 / KCTC 12554 / HTCC2601) TaxID=314265 RepID=Q0FMQ0_SALBH|nr:hypothetical protein R2601_15165 [Salipiger bermudensis HTCC2601]